MATQVQRGVALENNLFPPYFTASMADLTAQESDTRSTTSTTTAIDIENDNSTPQEMQHEITIPASNFTGSIPSSATGKSLTALQQHILFWDPDNDCVLWPSDIYNGFRAIGFSVPFSILSLLIPFYFSYPTTLGHSWFPDPYFRIYLDSIHKAKHGSDTGIYDHDGNFCSDRFEQMWQRFDTDNVGGLGPMDIWRLLAKDRVAADPAGWTFALMEWGSTWLLLQREGRVWKDDLKRVYDGTLFWTLKEKTKKEGGIGQGFGMSECLKTVRTLRDVYLTGNSGRNRKPESKDGGWIKEQ